MTTREEPDPTTRATPHAWPADRPLPEEGDFYWVRFNMIAPRPNGGVPVPLSEHWEPIVVTWLAALVPAQCFVRRIGDFPMIDSGAILEWGPRCELTPRPAATCFHVPIVRAALPTESGTYWTHTGYEHDTWAARELWNVVETDVLAGTRKALGLCVQYGDMPHHINVPVAEADIRWWCGPLPTPPQPSAREIVYQTEE